MNHHFSIFTNQPLTCLIKRRKLQLILHLFKLCIRQSFSIQAIFIILFQNILEIFPKIVLRL